MKFALSESRRRKEEEEEEAEALSFFLSFLQIDLISTHQNGNLSLTRSLDFIFFQLE